MLFDPKFIGAVAPIPQSFIISINMKGPTLQKTPNQLIFPSMIYLGSIQIIQKYPEMKGSIKCCPQTICIIYCSSVFILGSSKRKKLLESIFLGIILTPKIVPSPTS